MDYSEYLHIDDPHETTPSESLVIQYALELAVTYIRLACTAISIDWVAPPWIIKTSMLRHDSLRNPFNCLPCSNISQYTQRLLTKKKIYGWLYFTAYVTFGGTGDVKWICELSYLFKKQKVMHLAKFKVAFVHVFVFVSVHWFLLHMTLIMCESCTQNSQTQLLWKL